MKTSIVPLLLVLAACADSGGGGFVSKPGAHNVVQSGAQDFARFRAIVESGAVPSRATLDEVGFFAEHALDLPPADCGAEVCVHPALAVAPRFDGGNWTMSFVALNSPIDPATLPRPPAHLVLVVERSLAHELEAIAAASSASFRSDDRLSVIDYGDTARLIAERVPAGDRSWQDAVLHGLPYSEGASMYAGLQLAERVAVETSTAGEAARILLVTSGMSSTGISDPARVVALASGIAARGIALSVIGFAIETAEEESKYDDRLPLAIAELGAGTYSFAANSADLHTACELAGETALFPLATDFELTVRASRGYRIGRIYGAARARVRTTDTGEEAVLEAPALFLGHRTGASDVSKGRRGGGGGLFVELIADPSSALSVGAQAPAASIAASYRAAGEPRRSDRQLVNELAPGENPPGMWPSFSDPARGKAFMMLNMYLALRAMIDLHEDGDCAHARGILMLMEPSIAAWQAEHSDPDIEADRELLWKLERNIADTCSSGDNPRPPRNFSGGCFFI